MPGGSVTVIEAVTVAWSTVASALPLPPVAPALNVALALPLLIAASAPEIVPSAALLNVMGRPSNAVRSAGVTGEPDDGVKKSACKLVEELTWTEFGVAA